MSSQDPPIDPTAAAGAAGGGRQPSQEEVRAYLEQVRTSPVDQVVAEVASVLLNAVQVKLGRRDARLLLDLVGDLTDRVRGQVPDELTSQLGDVLAQLRLAQVEAEGEVAQAAAQGHEEPQDLPHDAAEHDRDGADTGGEGRTTGPAPSQPASEQPAPGSSAASRLWIPGR